MLDLALTNYDAATGRYNLDWSTGDVSFDDTMSFGVMSSVVCHRGTYWDDRTHGSDLHEIRNLTGKTADLAKSDALAAVAGLEQAALIEEVVVSDSVSLGPGGNRLDLDLSWSTPGGAGGTGRVRV